MDDLRPCQYCTRCRLDTLSVTETGVVRWLHLNLYIPDGDAYRPSPAWDDPEWTRLAREAAGTTQADIAAARAAALRTERAA